MKNILLPLNIILLAAVGFLFYRSYSGSSSIAKPNSSGKKDSSLPYQNRIAYFSIDSLESKFEYYKEEKTRLEKMQEDGNRRLADAERNLNARASVLTQQFQSNPTPELKAKIENELGNLQQSLQKEKQKLDTDLFNDGKTMNDDIQSKIQGYLKEYNLGKGFSYILSDAAGLMFYKDSALNITDDLIKGLNEKHKKTKQ